MIEARNGYDEKLFVQGRCVSTRRRVPTSPGTTTFHVRCPVASVIRDTLGRAFEPPRARITRSILQRRDRVSSDSTILLVDLAGSAALIKMRWVTRIETRLNSDLDALCSRKQGARRRIRIFFWERKLPASCFPMCC